MPWDFPSTRRFHPLEKMHIHEHHASKTGTKMSLVCGQAPIPLTCRALQKKLVDGLQAKLEPPL